MAPGTNRDHYEKQLEMKTVLIIIVITTNERAAFATFSLSIFFFTKNKIANSKFQTENMFLQSSILKATRIGLSQYERGCAEENH